MTGETIVINPKTINSHRVKRIKLNHGTASKQRGTSVSSTTDPTSFDEVEDGEEHCTLRDADEIKSIRVGRASGHDRGIDSLTTETAHAVIADSSSVASSDSRTPLVPLMDQLVSPSESNNGRRHNAANPNVDFSSAPSDSVGLAWWVAQQLTHFQVENQEPEAGYILQRTTSHQPGIQTRRSNADLGISQRAEREKQREDNRERKKRWRETHAERNKDNDLRCRINKRAKTKFGKGLSAEKTAYIEYEFNKRRNKREVRQRALANEIGRPSFAIASELVNHPPFATDGQNKTAKVQTAGTLLMNILLGASHGGKLEQSNEAAKTLRAALDDGSLDTQSTVEALRILAMNAEIMKGINAGLSIVDADDDSSGDEKTHETTQPAESPAASIRLQSVANSQDATEIIKALNAATALLNQMGDTKAYASPYSNPSPQATAVNGTGPLALNGSAQLPENSEPAGGHSPDQSQIDALLALANGGSLTDDEDDKTIADPDEIGAQQFDLSGQPQTDTDVTATLQRIINQSVKERNGGYSSNDWHMSGVNTFSDPYEAQSVRNWAATLQSLFAQAGVSINTVIPAAQGYATSQLYAHLSSRARPNPPLGSKKPYGHVSSIGNNIPTQQRVIANPANLSQNQHPTGFPLRIASSSSRNNMGFSMRAKNPEELLKIQSYGFPPLPGSRPGDKN